MDYKKGKVAINYQVEKTGRLFASTNGPLKNVEQCNYSLSKTLVIDFDYIEVFLFQLTVMYPEYFIW